MPTSVPVPVLSLLALPSLIASLPSQTNTGTPVPRPDRVAVHSRPDLHGRPTAEVWAAGQDYKASFHGGMTFVPYLGGEYPHNQPWSWRTESVRVGGRDLPLAGLADRVDAPYRVEYHLGAVVEAYDVRADGLEQTFVLAQRPTAEGALEIRGKVTTALHADAAAAAHQPIVFADAAGRAILAYGAATAVDADGDRFPMTTSFVAGELCLVLAAADLAVADFPLVVDPLLARWPTVSFPTLPVGVDGDVAHAEGSSSTPELFVFTMEASAADSDVWAVATAPQFWNPVTLFVDTGIEDCRAPSCAYVAGTGKWVIAYQELDAFGQGRIRVHNHAVADLTQRSNAIGLLRIAGLHYWRPDVGGTVAGSSTQALVVFQREDTGGTFGETTRSSVLGLLFDTTSTNGTFGVPFQISSTADVDSERPSVNQQAEGGTSFGWLCVWQEYNNQISGDDWDLIGRRVGNTGTLAAGSWVSDLASVGRHLLGPVVAGNEGHYAVLFTTCELAAGRTGSELGRDVRLECLQWFQGSASPATAGNRAPVTLRTHAQRALQAQGLAFDEESRSHWLATFGEVPPALPVTWYSRCGYQGQPLEGPNTVYAVLGNGPGPVAAAYDRAAGDFVLHFCVREATQLRVFGQRAQHPAVTPASRSGPSCSSAQLGWAGAAVAHPEKNQLIGCEDSALVGTSTNANAVHFVLCALATADLPVSDPVAYLNCRLLVAASGVGYLATLPIAIGSEVRWQFPLPEALGSVTLHFQDWAYHPDSNRIGASQRLTVPLVR